MSEFIFRQAKSEDIPACAKIYDRIADEQDAGRLTVGWVRGVYPTESDADTAFRNGELFVCELDGAVVASAVINKKQVDVYAEARWTDTAGAPENEVCVMHTLSVSPDIKRRGCGTAFEKFYEDYAASHGCRYLRIDTNTKNTRARRLYAGLGFREADVIPCTFNGIDSVKLVCFEKRLPTVIRKYSPRDKNDMRFICRATADSVFKRSDATRTAVTLIYNDYFTEREPENIFVIADKNDRAVGYIICCTDFEKFEKAFREAYIPKLIKTYPPFVFVAFYAIDAARRMRRHPHMHMDILPEYQRKSWGTRLINALREHLSENGKDTLAVCGARVGTPGYAMYTKYGFRTVKMRHGKIATLLIHNP